MTEGLAALAISSLVVLFGIPRARGRAFRRGWFERSVQTGRRRGERRPTHGGLVVAVGLAAGAALAGPDEPAARAAWLVALVAIATGYRAERGRGPTWLPAAGRLTVAVAVPVAGVRAELTASSLLDGLLTALIVLGVIAGLRSVERTDGTLPALAGVSGTSFVVIAERAGDPALPVAAAVVGAAFAAVALTWPPATVRLGAIGPTALGATLATVAIGLDIPVSAPTSLAVPVLALAAVGTALLVPGWDRRLRRRKVAPHLLIPLAAAPGALAAERLAAGAMELPLAALLALAPVAVLGIVGLATAPRRPPDWVDHRGRNIAVVAVTGCVLLAIAAFAGLLLIGARSDMQRGREFATAGLDAARDGELEKAQEYFRIADAAFDDAATSLHHPAVRVGEVVPVIAPNLHSAQTLADVGRDLSGTAVAVSERAGADDLLVVDGRFPIEASAEVSEELQPALATLQDAARRLDAAGSPLLLDEVYDGSLDVAERVDDATVTLAIAAEATRLAPSLLGGDGDRRWMLAVVTPAEQRGAGGLAGDYAELKTSDGDIDLVQTLPASKINGLTDPATQLAAVPAVYRENYGGWRVGRFWQNLPATPDIPTFGQAVATAYPLTRGGGPVDGVITIDPYGIAALLEITGPVTVPDWPVPLTSENAAQVLLFDHYNVLTQDQIDEFQGDVIEEVVDALTTGTLPRVADLAATMGPQVSGGHLRFWSPEAAPQALFERIGADGTLGGRPSGADFVQLVTQNDGENKIDWFMRRSLAYDATVDPANGALTATATVTITNMSPATGVSSYIIGETPGPTRPGVNALEVTVFTPHRVVAVTDGGGTSLRRNLARERGLQAVTVFFEIPPGGTATMQVELEGVVGNADDSYRLVVGHQPTVVPDHVEASVRPTKDWVTTEGGGATVISDADGEISLMTRFER